MGLVELGVNPFDRADIEDPIACTYTYCLAGVMKRYNPNSAQLPGPTECAATPSLTENRHV
jgi:hypothetical protein